MSSLEKCLFKSFAHFLIRLFVFLEWSRVSSLYILEIRPLSEVSLANMFSYTFDSLFILMLISFAVQKLFILMRSHLFILSSMSLALGDISVFQMLNPLHFLSVSICTMMSSNSYIFLKIVLSLQVLSVGGLL